jgi:hypothetical protein
MEIMKGFSLKHSRFSKILERESFLLKSGSHMISENSRIPYMYRNILYLFYRFFFHTGF